MLLKGDNVIIMDNLNAEKECINISFEHGLGDRNINLQSFVDFYSFHFLIISTTLSEHIVFHKAGNVSNVQEHSFNMIS